MSNEFNGNASETRFEFPTKKTNKQMNLIWSLYAIICFLEDTQEYSM